MNIKNQPIQSNSKLDGWLALLVGLAAIGPRLYSLDIFLTADEPKSWFGRSIQFLDAIARADWAATFDSPAPGVTTMWAGSLGLLLEYARQGFPGPLTEFLAAIPFDPLDPAILPLIRLPVVLAATLTAVLTYWWGKSLFGRPAALLAALLIALDPFLLALTRILGHDGLVTLFMWLSLLAFLHTLPPPTSNPNPPRFAAIRHSPFLIISGALGGLAFLSKYPSLFLGAFVAVTLLILYIRQRGLHLQTLRAWLVAVVLWSAAAGTIFVLLWPVMWVDPIGRVLAIISDALRASGSPHQKGSFFFGQPVTDPGASYYLIVTLFKTTPVLWLGWLLLAVSFIPTLFRKQDIHHASRQFTIHNSRSAILILLAFAFAFALLVTIGGKKQDRYILPIFPVLAMLSAIGYAQVQLPIKNENFRIKLALLAGVVFIHALFVLPAHPYYFTYYNPLLGGAEAAAEIMIVGWGEGLDEAARWLNTQPDAENIDVVAWYSTTFEPYFEGNAIYKIDEEKISRTAKPGLAADYVVLYINQIQRELPTLGALQFFRAEPPAHVVTLNGVEYAWIYPSVAMQHVIGDESRLVGQAELQGYNLLNERGERVETLAADRPTTIELYWEWQGKALDEPIGLALVDDAGHPWGWGHPFGTEARFPFDEWQEGMVAHDDFVLGVYPGTPPGQYWLKPWIDRPAAGERVGDFPITADMQVTVERPAAPLPDSDLNLTTRLNHRLFDGAIELVGIESGADFNAPWLPGEQRDLLLYWRSVEPTSEDYSLTLRLSDINTGQVRTTWQGAPALGRFPTGQWQSGDLVRDPWQLALPAHVPPGDYQLTAQLGQATPISLLEVTIEGRPRRFEPPPLDLPLETRFGENIELLGLTSLDEQTLVASPGQPLEFDLVWRARDLMDADYTITVQLLDAQQQVQAQRDSAPLDGGAPTSSWTAGEVLTDPISLNIPAEVGPSPHYLLLALYHFETGERLPLPDGADHLTIPVIIPDDDKTRDRQN